jgi:hypothetical protein
MDAQGMLRGGYSKGGQAAAGINLDADGDDANHGSVRAPTTAAASAR